MIRISIGGSTWLAALFLASCGGGDAGVDDTVADSGSTSAASESAARGPVSVAATTRTEMRNVDLVVDAGIVLHIELLRGWLAPHSPGDPVVLDDQTSYVLHIDTASTSMTYEALTNLMNDRIFAYDGAPLGGLEVRREDDEDQHDRVEVKGHLRHQADLPFEIEGVPEITPDGEIRMSTSSMEVIGIEMGGLLHTFGAEAEDLIATREERGVRIEGDDMLLVPARMLAPPPAVGRVTAVEVGARTLSMTFGSGSRPPASAGSSDTAGASDTADRGPGSIAYRGGRVRLGRMTMTDADLTIVNDDSTDAFRFRPAQMNQQLEEGYVKIRPDGGLTIFAPDAP